MTRIHIEQLVIDRELMGHETPNAVREALERELAALLQQHRVSPAAASFPPRAPLMLGSRSAGLGRALADTLGAQLTQSVPAQSDAPSPALRR